MPAGTSKQSRKCGRNLEKCKRYRAQDRREIKKIKRYAKSNQRSYLLDNGLATEASVKLTRIQKQAMAKVAHRKVNRDSNAKRK